MMGETQWRPPTTSNNRRASENPALTGEVLHRLGVSPCEDFASSSASSYYPNGGSLSSNPSATYAVPMKKRSSQTAAMVDGVTGANNLSASTSSSSNSSTMRAIVGTGVGHVGNFSSSFSSSSMSGVEYKSHKRFTMPSILTTTTSDTTSDFSEQLDLDDNMEVFSNHFLHPECEPGSSMHLRRAAGSVDSGIPSSRAGFEFDALGSDDDLIDFGKLSAGVEGRKAAFKIGSLPGSSFHSNVRRVSSFTSASTRAVTAKTQERQHRRSFFGKTLNFIRNKVDSSSQTVLCPTLEDVQAWREKMENLLENKYGCYLFGEFLEKEYSRENLDFALKCREYKALFQNSKKNAKKIARLAKEINDAFLVENAPREVNLEASVRSATKAGLAELKEDTFSLAQNKIEQLIANDKYQRFLKSKEYTTLVRSLNRENARRQSSNGDPGSSASVTTTTTPEETPLLPVRKVRSASAADDCVAATSGETADPTIANVLAAGSF